MIPLIFIIIFTLTAPDAIASSCRGIYAQQIRSMVDAESEQIKKQTLQEMKYSEPDFPWAQLEKMNLQHQYAETIERLRMQEMGESLDPVSIQYLRKHTKALLDSKNHKAMPSLIQAYRDLSFHRFEDFEQNILKPSRTYRIDPSDFQFLKDEAQKWSNDRSFARIQERMSQQNKEYLQRKGITMFDSNPNFIGKGRAQARVHYQNLGPSTGTLGNYQEHYSEHISRAPPVIGINASEFQARPRNATLFHELMHDAYFQKRLQGQTPMMTGRYVPEWKGREREFDQHQIRANLGLSPVRTGASGSFYQDHMVEEEIPIHLRGLLYSVRAGNRVVLNALEKGPLPIQRVFDIPILRRTAGGISELSDRKIFFSEQLDQLLAQMMDDPKLFNKIRGFGYHERVMRIQIQVSPGLTQVIQIQDPKLIRWFRSHVKSTHALMESAMNTNVKRDSNSIAALHSEAKKWIFRIRQMEAEKRTLLKEVYDESLALYDWATQHIQHDIQVNVDQKQYLKIRDAILKVQGLEKKMRQSEVLEKFKNSLP